VSGIAAEVQADKALASRIKHKFKIKNTVSDPQSWCTTAAFAVAFTTAQHNGTTQ
jgi:hypothetical protein